jgi:hypothetical protein
MFKTKKIPNFPDYLLGSDGTVMYRASSGYKNFAVHKDRHGLKYVILSNDDVEIKAYLVAFKFPRGDGYKDVIRLKKRQMKKLEKLKAKSRAIGKHHKSLTELRISSQKFRINRPVQADKKDSIRSF